MSKFWKFPIRILSYSFLTKNRRLYIAESGGKSGRLNTPKMTIEIRDRTHMDGHSGTGTDGMVFPCPSPFVSPGGHENNQWTGR